MEEKREINQETDVKEETAEQMQPEEPENGQAAAEDTAAADNGTAEASEEDTAEDSAETKDAAKDKGGFFRKKEKKDKKDEKIEGLTDRVKRQMAEFDNFRKRTEREKSQMFETGAKSIIGRQTHTISSSHLKTISSLMLASSLR